MQDFVLQRSRRRTIAIHVQDNRVEVRAPLKAARHEIDAFVEQKKHWIQVKLAESRQRAQEALVLRDGQVVTVMGRAITLHRRQAAKVRLHCEQGLLIMEGPVLDDAQAEKLFRRWLAEEAGLYLVQRARAVIQDLGLESRSSGFTLRYTRSLWGRCLASGEILFNPFILLAPVRVIEYLIAHEVCHLQFMNHSQAFWQLVASVCPDWQESRCWLREHGHRLRVK